MMMMIRFHFWKMPRFNCFSTIDGSDSVRVVTNSMAIRRLTFQTIHLLRASKLCVTITLMDGAESVEIQLPS